MCRNLRVISYNRHEADLNCVTAPNNKHKRTFATLIKSTLFIIKKYIKTIYPSLCFILPVSSIKKTWNPFEDAMEIKSSSITA